MDYWLTFTTLFVTIMLLCQVSSRANYIGKYFYLYSSYMLSSIVICIICLPRPRHPDNGVIAAKLLRYVNSLVPITFTITDKERLQVPSAAVLLLNHQSAIDLMTLMEIWPIVNNAAPVAKRSLLYSGPFGLACWLVGCVFIDRNSKKSRQMMTKSGEIAKQRGTKLIVFPEGTRHDAKDLQLLPFKKGAFHIALDEKLPILPVVISRYNFLDHENMTFDRGNVEIQVLPRIDTSLYSKENINELVSYTQEIMTEALRGMEKKI